MPTTEGFLKSPVATWDSCSYAGDPGAALGFPETSKSTEIVGGPAQESESATAGESAERGGNAAQLEADMSGRRS